MKSLAALLATTAVVAIVPPLEAATLHPGSRIADVVLYPDAAIIKREIIAEVPVGSHEILIADLPATLDPASLRIEGASEGKLTLGNLDLRARAATEDDNPERVKKLNALRLEKDRLSDRIDAVEGRKGMIQRAANPSDKEGRLEPDQWAKAWEAVGKGLQAANDELRGLRIEEAKIDAEIASLEEVSTRQMQQQGRRTLAISLEAPAATKARLTLSYRVRQAGWRPIYDARLVTRNPAPSLELTRRAILRQNTGEDWKEAKVTLSTTQVARGTTAPVLYGERIGFEPPPAPRAAPVAAAPGASAAMAKAQRMEMAVAGAVSDTARTYAEQPIEEIGAAFSAGSFEGEYLVPGLVSLPSGGAEKSFRLGSDKPEVQLSLRAAPALDPTAYLEAAFSLKGDAPLLPGEVLLTRDETFVGKSTLPLTPPGEKVRLGFGADDSVKIKRVVVAQKTSEPGLLGSTKSARSEFRITAKNLHAFPVALILEERIPVSEDQGIVVERASEMTKPDAEAPEERRGIIQWKPTLKGGEERAFTSAYTLRWPADKPTRTTPLPR